MQTVSGRRELTQSPAARRALVVTERRPAPHRHLLPPFRPLFRQELGQGGGEGLAGGGRDSEGAGWKRTFDT